MQRNLYGLLSNPDVPLPDHELLRGHSDEDDKAYRHEKRKLYEMQTIADLVKDLP
jgi:hypothetical protein